MNETTSENHALTPEKIIEQRNGGIQIQKNRKIKNLRFSELIFMSE